MTSTQKSPLGYEPKPRPMSHRGRHLITNVSITTMIHKEKIRAVLTRLLTENLVNDYNILTLSVLESSIDIRI